MSADVVRELLSITDYEVDVAKDGRDAVAMASRARYDIILMDWNMPKMDGREFVKNLRTMPEMEHVPVLMVTTHAERNDVVLALQAGVNDYVVKPFTPELLQEKITSLAVKVRA